MAANQPGIFADAQQNRMIHDRTFSEVAATVQRFIASSHLGQPGEHAPSPGDERVFNALALALFALQHEHVGPYREWCARRRSHPGNVRHWRAIPAVPTSAFKQFEFTSLPASQRTTVFESSGTTGYRPSRHFHHAASLRLYEASLLPWFRRHCLPGERREEAARPRFLILTPPPSASPHSSLVHMFETVRQALGASDSAFCGTRVGEAEWDLDWPTAWRVLGEAVAGRRPLWVLGTAFSFVHLADELERTGQHCQLPPGSSALETGGYKGRSRILSREALHALVGRQLGLEPEAIGCEYGMCELGSQAYDRVLGVRPAHLAEAPPVRVFRFPPWARTTVISPETGQEVGEGEAGLLRVVDLANVWSVAAIQTEDVVLRRGTGFELLGRAAEAEPRGCSLRSLALPTLGVMP